MKEEIETMGIKEVTLFINRMNEQGEMGDEKDLNEIITLFQGITGFINHPGYERMTFGEELQLMYYYIKEYYINNI